jgi:hypothetical protein
MHTGEYQRMPSDYEAKLELFGFKVVVSAIAKGQQYSTRSSSIMPYMVSAQFCGGRDRKRFHLPWTTCIITDTLLSIHHYLSIFEVLELADGNFQVVTVERFSCISNYFTARRVHD